MYAENKDIIKTGKKKHIHCSAIPQAQQNVYTQNLYTTILNFYTGFFFRLPLNKPVIPHNGLTNLYL